MKTRKKRVVRLRWLGVSVISVLAACGGSGGHDVEVDESTLSGSVFASAVSGSSCEVKDRSGDTVIGSFSTSSDGSYSVILPSDQLSESFRIECSGGTFTDEATGFTDQSAGAMSAYIAGGLASADRSIHITPPSTIVHDLVTHHGKTAVEAEAVFEAAFGFSPDYVTAPSDATNPVDNAEKTSLRSGLRAATFSQLASDLGLLSSDQFALFSALSEDLADGVLDGLGASGAVTVDGTSITLPVDIQNRFGDAMVNFRSGGRDESGLAHDDIGILPFAKIAMTESYKLEYVPGMYGAVNGQTKFTLKVSDLSGTPQEGLNVSIKPKMNMKSMVHSTPFEATCNESKEAGAYNCRLYYLMPSVMMNGMSMGFWELKVTVGLEGESTTFYPKVTMAMGDTAQVRLKGQNDKISSSMNHGSGMNGMAGETEARTYFIFKQTLTGVSNNHTFEFFIAAKENMMNFPAVSMGSTLSAGDMQHALSITTMSVEVSSDAIDWRLAAEKEGNPGHWIASGISGLTDGSQGTLYVRLVVEGEQKTTDGAMPNDLPASDDTNNNFAKFSVTLGRSGMSM